jgi:hypothetical protein
MATRAMFDCIRREIFRSHDHDDSLVTHYVNELWLLELCPNMYADLRERVCAPDRVYEVNMIISLVL